MTLIPRPTMHPRMDISSIVPHPSRVARLVVIALALAACGGRSLGNSEWLWCKEHLASVDAAAEGLGIAKVQTTIQEPTWWSDYVTSALNRSNALIGANADFVAACNAAADKAGLGESRVSWCMTDGLGDTWTAAIGFGQIVNTDAETFAYRALPLSQRINNAEFVSACRTAFASRTN